MLTLNDGRSELWQWDMGRKLTVDADCSQVHFSNKVFGRSIDVDVVDGVATIPDVLLQSDKDLTVWAFVGTTGNGYTKISKVFKVNKRNKPADYVFTPQDQTTLEEIVNRLEDLENQKPTAGFVKTINGIEPDENGNIYVPTGTGSAVQYVAQTLTDEQRQQARKNIGASSGLISILDIDPAEPQEGQMWILKTATKKLTTPVIELGTVGENSVEIKLSNASFDGSGAVVASYNIYVNGELNKTENIAAGGTCVVAGLSPETEYQISVRGVSGAVLSAMSNTLTATTLEEPEGEMKIIVGLTTKNNNGNISIEKRADNARAATLFTTGKKACVNNVSEDVYYPVPVPVDATSVTVICPVGIQFGYNGWKLSDNTYTYTVDSGWKRPGDTYSFKVGAADYYSIIFHSESLTALTDADIAGITITFA